MRRVLLALAAFGMISITLLVLLSQGSKPSIERAKVAQARLVGGHPFVAKFTYPQWQTPIIGDTTSSGSWTQGDTASTTTGTWTGNPASYAYQWQDCNTQGLSCSNITGATSSTYVLAAGDVGQTVRSVVTACNPAGCGTSNSAVSAVIAASNSGFTLPAGVTLQPVDGGHCTTSTGPCQDNYYCTNGFTNACNNGNVYPAKSWDDPTFFPIEQDYWFCSQSGNAAQWATEGLNVASRLNSDCSSGSWPNQLQTAGLWVIAGSDQYTDSPDCQTAGFGAGTVGWHIDEPVTWNQSAASDCAAMAQPNPSVTTATTAFNDFAGGLTGRFIQPVMTANEYPNAPVSANKIATGVNAIPPSCGSVANSVVAMQSVMTCTSGMPSGRHIDIASLDTYWFAGSGTGNVLAPSYAGYCTDLYGTCAATTDNVGRGSNYGDAVDAERAWTAAPHVPAGVFLETGNALAGAGARNITPAEFNWGAWSQIVHGARMLQYFQAPTAIATAGFPTTSVGGTTMAAQGAATDTLVEQLAPIINSPFALNYATNNVGGYVFPTEHLQLDNGIDMSVHYFTGSPFSNSAGTFTPGFYIIASVRGSESQTVPINATFTVANGDNTPTGAVQDVCACSPTQSTGTVSYSSTTRQFTESFAHTTDVHIIGPFEGIAPASQPLGDPTGKTWSLVFDDEFLGSSIDTTRWAAVNWNLNNVTGSAADCTETGGTAILALPGNSTGCDLMSAPGYGAGVNGYTLNVGDYAEARVWFPSTPSGSVSDNIDNWPAWWALGVNPGGSGEPGGEIDIAEALGQLQINYHSASANNSGPHPTGNWGNSWHVFGVYRTSTQDQVYWDGVLVWTITTADNGTPETLILTSGASNACCGAPSVTGAPGNVYVDWVRAWR